MSAHVPEQHPLRRLFREAAEWAFRYGALPEPRAQQPELQYYLSEDLLTRFLRTDQLYRLRDARGRPLADVAEMLISGKSGGAAAELPALTVQRHIGDYTLFITGVFPESLARLKRDWRRKDAVMMQLGDLVVPFHDPEEYYEEAGRRAYRRAFENAREAGVPEADVFDLLSAFFRHYVRVLNLVRVYLDAAPEFEEHKRVII